MTRLKQASVGAGYALALVLPLSVYWPIGSSVAPDVFDLYARPGLYLADPVVGVLFLAHRFGSQRPAGRQVNLRLTAPLLALVVLALLTAPLALSPRLAGYVALRWLAASGVCWVLARAPLSLDTWVRVFMAGLGVHVVVGVGQVLHQGRLGLPGELALDLTQPGAAILAVGGRHWLRAYGLTFHPNVLGGFVAVGLLLGLPLLGSRRVRLLWWLLWLGLWLSFSRSAWLAVALVLPITAGGLAWRDPPRRRALSVALAGAAVMGLAAAVLLAGQLSSRFRPWATPTEARSLRERGELMAVAFDLIGQRPVFGVGAGNFPLAVRDAYAPVLPQPVHNVPLLLAAEVGVWGAAVWFWLWLAPAWAVSRYDRQSGPWLGVLLGAWMALAIVGLWDSYPWALNAGLLLTMTLLGLLNSAL